MHGAGAAQDIHPLAPFLRRTQKKPGGFSLQKSAEDSFPRLPPHPPGLALLQGGVLGFHRVVNDAAGPPGEIHGDQRVLGHAPLRRGRARGRQGSEVKQARQCQWGMTNPVCIWERCRLNTPPPCLSYLIPTLGRSLCRKIIKRKPDRELFRALFGVQDAFAGLSWAKLHLCYHKHVEATSTDYCINLDCLGCCRRADPHHGRGERREAGRPLLWNVVALVQHHPVLWAGRQAFFTGAGRFHRLLLLQGKDLL